MIVFGLTMEKLFIRGTELIYVNMIVYFAFLYEVFFAGFFFIFVMETKDNYEVGLLWGGVN